MSETNLADAATAGFETVQVEAMGVMGLWQENAGRMLRAQERMMQGMMAAAKLQFELGQELLAQLVATMRDVSEEMRPSSGDAARLAMPAVVEPAPVVVAEAEAEPEMMEAVADQTEV